MQIGLGDLLKLCDELVGVGHETIGLLTYNALAQKRRGALHIGQRRAELGDEFWDVRHERSRIVLQKLG